MSERLRASHVPRNPAPPTWRRRSSIQPPPSNTAARLPLHAAADRGASSTRCQSCPSQRNCAGPIQRTEAAPAQASNAGSAATSSFVSPCCTSCQIQAQVAASAARDSDITLRRHQAAVRTRKVIAAEAGIA
jgi:hypothetical protein